MFGIAGGTTPETAIPLSLPGNPWKYYVDHLEREKETVRIITVRLRGVEGARSQVRSAHSVAATGSQKFDRQNDDAAENRERNKAKFTRCRHQRRDTSLSIFRLSGFLLEHVDVFFLFTSAR